MSRSSRVVGVMLVHDEWPLVAYSAAHALVHHVDELWIIDHHSTDPLLDGVEVLAQCFGDRLHVMRLGDVAYRQAAIIAWALERIRPDASDWIYVLDADEFLLTDPSSSLRDVLNNLSENITTVRYGVDNFVAPRDLVLTCAADLSRVVARSRATVSEEVPGAELAHQVHDGHLSFFDVPFKSKVIARGVQTWFLAGAHGVAGQRVSDELAIEPGTVRAGHLVLLSRERLDRRAKAGRRLVEAGFGADHGWQSQLLWTLEQSGQLDEFWIRHSVGEGGPAYDHDPALAKSMEVVVDRLAPYEAALRLAGTRESHESADASADDVFRSYSQLLHRVQRSLEARSERMHEMVDELTALRGEKNELSRQRSELEIQQRDIHNSASWRVGQAITRLNIFKRRPASR